VNAARSIAIIAAMLMAACATWHKRPAFDLPQLLDRPDELRSRLARGFRDALVPTFEARELKFEDRPSAARD
jgi:hypothetical protein